MRNTIPKLYNAVPAPVTRRPDALADRVQCVRDASLLYNMMMENMVYGRERLKDMKKEAAEEEKPAAAKKKKKPARSNDKNQQHPKNSNKMMSDMIRLQK